MKKILSMLVMLAMLLAVCAGAMAAQNQITYGGGTRWYDKEGNTLHVSGEFTGNSNAWVELSKTIEATGTENEFIVTMDVKTKQNIKTLSSKTPNAATVLVIDVSNSMDQCVECGGDLGGEVHTGKPQYYYCDDTHEETYYDGKDKGKDCDRCGKSQNNHNIVYSTPECAVNKSRMEEAKDAAIAFVRDFGQNTGATGDNKRKVAVVLYGSDAWSNNTWYDVATASGLTAAEAHIRSIEMRNGSNSIYDGGTNFEGGLMLAKNVLNAGLAENGAINGYEYLYTILLTDGEPTYHVEDNDVSNDTEHIEGTAGGSDKTIKDDAKDVGMQAQAIRELGGKGLSKLYSICMGEELWDKEPFETWNDANPKTTENMTIGEWLAAFSTEAYDGEATNLFDSFDAVMYQIQLAAKAWRVADWMGDHITYLGPVAVKTANGNGTVFNSVIENPTDAELAHNTHGMPDYVWNILGSETTYDNLVVHQDGTVSGYVGYTYKYKVRLENQRMAYHNALLEGNGSTEVNNLATLKYVVTDEEGNWPTEGGIHTATFLKPEVKGLLGELVFDKVDQNGDKIQGDITFRLRADHYAHEGEQSETVWNYADATTDANGRVVFRNIPSGHDYKLIEAETDFDDGYDYANSGNVDVDVDWGVAYSRMTDQNHDGVAELVNRKTEYPLANLVLEKAFGENSVIPASIKMRVTGKNSLGETVFSGEYTLYSKDAKDGVWTWVLGDLEPSLTYTVEELNALDANGNPLKESHNLTWTVHVNGEQKDADTFVSGEATTYPKTPNAITIASGGSATVRFTNTMTKKAGSLTVSKHYEGLPQNLSGNAVTITVTPADGSDAKTIELNSGNGWRHTFTNLPIGEYTVTESAMGDVDNYRYVYNEFVSGGTTKTNAISVGVQENTDTAVAVTNYYEEKLGTIVVTKDFPEHSDLQGSGAVLSNKVIRATVYGENGYVQEIELSQANNWTRILPGLPMGRYAVVENVESAQVPHFTLSVGYSPAEKVQMNGQEIDAAVDVLEKDDDRKILDIWNTYEQDTATITVRKTITGDLNNNSPELADKEFSVSILDQNGNAVGEPLKLNKANGWSATSEPLDETQTYTIVESETGAPIENYDWSYDVYADESGVPNNKVTLLDNTHVGIVNEYTMHRGNVKIAKTIEGIDDAALVPKKITVILTHQETGNDYNAELHISGSAAQGWKAEAELKGLPVGEYTVKEGADAQVPGYDPKATFAVNGKELSANATFEITKDTEITLSIKNEYDKHMGLLTVEKKFGSGMSQNLQNLAYAKTYTVYVLDKDGKEAAKVELKGTEWKQTIELPLGTYTLLEESDSAQISGYVLDVRYGKAAELKHDGDKATATVTNTYTVKHGTLELIKRNVGNPGRMPEDIRFSIIAGSGDTESGMPYNGSVTLSAENNWTEMLTLEPGIYVLKEDTDDATTGITWTGAGIGSEAVAGNAVTITIVHEATATVICTNDYEYFHDLTFHKLNSYDDSPMSGVEFTLTHRAHNTEGNETCKDNIAPMTAESDQNGEVTFTGIEAGHVYTLTETEKIGFTTMEPVQVIVSDRGITVTGDLTDYVVYNTPNNWPTHELEFTKVNHQTHEGIAGIEFALKHSSKCPACSGQPADRLDDTWTATSDTDGAVKFTGLPEKHTYILEETKHDHYLHNGPWTVVVSENGAQITDGPTDSYTYQNGYVIENAPISYSVAKVSFLKHNSYMHAPLPGAIFTLKHAEDCAECSEEPDDILAEPMTATSDADGLVEFLNVPTHHSYTLTEKAPEGFTAIEPVTVRVETTGVTGLPTYNGVIYNNLTEWPTLNLTFTKLSSVDNKPLAGIGFMLTHDDVNCDTCKNTPAGMNKLPANITGWALEEPVLSTAEGTVTITGIPAMHRYTLTETPSESYVPLTPVTVRASRNSVLMEGVENNKIYNTPSNWPRTAFSFYKHSTYTQSALPGVTFTLKHHDNCICAGLPSDVDDTLTATSDENGLVSFTGVPEGHAYLLSEVTPSGYAPVGPWKVNVYTDNYQPKVRGLPVNEQNILYNSLTDWPTLPLSFHKHSKLNDTPIEGIEFTITHSCAAGECIGLPEGIASRSWKAVSDENGLVSFPGLPVKHSYTLKETKNEGYLPAANMAVEVTATSVTVDGKAPDNLIVYNVPRDWPAKDLEFKKYSKLTGGPIEGIEFTITHSCVEGKCIGLPEGIEDRVWKVKSDSEGLVKFEGLPVNHDYTLKETGYEGYIPVSDMTVSVTEAGVTVVGMPKDGIVYNVPAEWPMTELSFYKYSNYTKEALKGVKFTLTHSDACVECSGIPEAIKTPKEVLSDDRGLVLFTGVPVNHTYVISEAEAPAGYVKMADLTVTVKQGENGVIITGLENGSVIYNERKDWPTENITFTKISAFDGRVLAGATFDLVHIHDVQAENYCCAEVIDIAEATTDIYGKVTLTDVPRQHTYVLTETKVPAGYKAIAPMVVRVMEGEPITIGGEKLTTGFAIKDMPTYWPVEIQLTASKTMDGEIPTDAYTFVVSNARGEVERVQNSAGMITFSKYLFEKPGRYEFTIAELPGENPNVVYDSAVYTVTVDVKADANGKLSAQVSLKKNGLAHEDGIVFANMTMPMLPATGDNSQMALWCAVLALAGAGIVLMKRRRA